MATLRMATQRIFTIHVCVNTASYIHAGKLGEELILEVFNEGKIGGLGGSLICVRFLANSVGGILIELNPYFMF